MSLQGSDPSEVDSPAEAADAIGERIFPLVSGRKIPAVEGGLNAASADPAVHAWWRDEHPNCNWGLNCGQSGLAVIDIDGEAGEQSWAVLCLTYGDPPATREVKTPHGRHLYFRGRLPSSVSKLGAGLDIRSLGGYVVIPPSTVDGVAYEIVNDAKPAPLPDWIGQRLATARQVARIAPADIELDRPLSIAAAKAEIDRLLAADRADVAIEGQGGDTRTYKLAARMADLGVSQEMAVEIMEPWNEACDPPWGHEEFAAKVAQGYLSRQNEIGCDAPRTAAEEFAGEVPAGWLADQVARNAFYPWSPGELANRPPPPWLIEGEIERHGRAMIYGPTNTGKTFTVLNYLLPLTLAGHDIVYVAGEDDIGHIEKRARAWAEFNDAVAAYEANFRVVETMPLANPRLARDFCAALQANGVRPAVVVIDTLSTALAGRKENDATDLADFWDVCKVIEAGLGTSLFLVHHTGKDTDRGARGSSNIAAGLTTMFELKANEKAGLILLWMEKQRNAPKLTAPITFATVSHGGSLVLRRLLDDERRERHEAGDANPSGVTVDECAEALANLGAVSGGQSVTTSVLASEIALLRTKIGRLDVDENNIGRSLRNKCKAAKDGGREGVLLAFVAHHAEHRGDEIKWLDRCVGDSGF